MKTSHKKNNEKRLAAYAAAAGAALVAASPADAAIQYTSSDLTVNKNSNVYIDIDGSGDWDFLFKHLSWSSYYRGVTFVWNLINPNANASFMGYMPPYSQNVVFNLNSGQSINAAKHTWINNQGALFGFSRFLPSVNNFPVGSSGYVGIRFDPGDGVKYGWIHIDSVPSDHSYHIDGWAYEDSAAFITAGQTVVPEPSSIALFAAGAAALSARKLRRKKAKADESCL